ncbi:MAG TPA: Holliday junction branch migration protein RuvA [Phycisphaerae bacterium]|nr:Holliday junction branch migration protein RuvA [Phycisphaerae bacterium]
MIARISGQLESLADDRVVVAAGSVAYEVMVAPVTADDLRPFLGRQVALHTLEYFDGNPAYGQMVPRLIGFLSETERRFFVRYVSVQGIGIAKGLRSLVLPVGQIAERIESRDAAALAQLPGIGRRTADKIIAELCGKLDEFAVAVPGGRAWGDEPESKREAVSVLMSLGLARPEAVERVNAAFERLGDKADVEQLVREAFHQGPTSAEG